MSTLHEEHQGVDSIAREDGRERPDVLDGLCRERPDGVSTRLLLNDGDLTVHSYQDVEDIVERNKRLAREAQPSRRREDWGRHVATIPNNILLQWLNEEWARGNVDLRMGSKEFDALIARKLRDPDWRFLRVDK